MIKPSPAKQLWRVPPRNLKSVDFPEGLTNEKHAYLVSKPQRLWVQPSWILPQGLVIHTKRMRSILLSTEKNIPLQNIKSWRHRPFREEHMNTIRRDTASLKGWANVRSQEKRLRPNSESIAMLKGHMMKSTPTDLRLTREWGQQRS